jgi:hypothetical protein
MKANGKLPPGCNAIFGMLGILVAVQLAAGGLLCPASAAAHDAEQALLNRTLPVPPLSRLQVKRIMQAPAAEPAATIAGAAEGQRQAAYERQAPPAGDTVASATANGQNEPATASQGQVDGTTAGPATDGQELAWNILPPVMTGDLGGPIVIDNDEANEAEATIEYEDLPTDEEKTHVKAGARFPVVIACQLSSRTAKKGDPVQARLKYDLKIGDKLIARKGAYVRGHISSVLPARTILHSLVSPRRWYRNSGLLGIAFDEIINEKGEHLPLVAQPARKSRIIKNKGEGRVLGVNHMGQVVGPWSQQLRYKAIRVGLNAALAPAGVFSFGAMPVALGVIGAVNPSFAFSKPVGLNVRHRRLKGFAWGFLSGFPGSWIIEDTVVKGQEAIIKPGDEFLVEFRQEFTGEPATDAQLLPGASTKVRGQVIDDGKSQGKKSKGK